MYFIFRTRKPGTNQGEAVEPIFSPVGCRQTNPCYTPVSPASKLQVVQIQQQTKQVTNALKHFTK